MNKGEIHTIDGVNFNIAEQGEGEPLVLLHGGYSNLRVWEGHVDVLAKKYRVIRYDQRGYGKSDTANVPFSYYQDLKTVYNQLGIGCATMIASSFGGSAAIDFALAYPDCVNRLILVAPSVNGAKYPLRLSYEGMKDFMRVRRVGIEKAADHFVQNAYWRYLVPEDPLCRAQFKDLYLSNERFYQGKPSLHQPLTPHAYKRLNEIKQPVLIIEAERDLPFNRRICDFLHESIIGSSLVKMENCGHYPHLERPAEFMEVALKFLGTGS